MAHEAPGVVCGRRGSEAGFPHMFPGFSQSRLWRLICYDRLCGYSAGTAWLTLVYCTALSIPWYDFSLMSTR